MFFSVFRPPTSDLRPPTSVVRYIASVKRKWVFRQMRTWGEGLHQLRFSFVCFVPRSISFLLLFHQFRIPVKPFASFAVLRARAWELVCKRTICQALLGFIYLRGLRVLRGAKSLARAPAKSGAGIATGSTSLTTKPTKNTKTERQPESAHLQNQRLKTTKTKIDMTSLWCDDRG